MFLPGLLVLILVSSATATEVEACKVRNDYVTRGRTGQAKDGLAEDVQLTPCKKIPCRLKKNTSTHIKIKFVPETDLSEIKNHVTAKVFGVDVPFIGVDGLSICDKIETESGEKAPCPLKAGTTYIYNDSFPILSIYPNLETKVHWALQHNDKDVKCFEVPAKIVG